jgi:hypothetical protein
MEDQHQAWLPRVDEPMEEYLKSDSYRDSSTGITFSDFAGQEEANYDFWRHLTHSQRLELHTIIVSSLFADEFKKNKGRISLEIVFTDQIS